MGTLSKAIGVSGGFVAGPEDFTSFLVNTSRPFIFSTAPSPALAGAALAALDILAVEPDRRTRLWGNRARLLDGLSSMGYTLTPTQSPILPVLLKDPELAVRMSRALLEEGIFIPAIRPPTVPRHTSRLRITVTADHTPSHIDTCLSALHRVGKALRII
jgi:7-keto-8-aminopelargonate synthetase-like enzyme